MLTGAAVMVWAADVVLPPVRKSKSAPVEDTVQGHKIVDRYRT